MSKFSPFRTRLHRRALHSLLTHSKTSRQSVSLTKAQSIGILFDGTELADREVVLKFADQLKKQQKKVKLLAFLDNREDNQSFPFLNFNRKEIDLFLRPKKQEVKDFMDKPFDLLIGLAMEPLPPLDFVAAGSKAGFRVGLYGEHNACYDLLIDLPAGKRNIQELIRQVEIYLNKMDADHERATA